MTAPDRTTLSGYPLPKAGTATGRYRARCGAGARAGCGRRAPAGFQQLDQREFDALHRGVSGSRQRSQKIKRRCSEPFLSCAQLRDVYRINGLRTRYFCRPDFSDILKAYIAGAAYDKEVVECHTNTFILARMEQYHHNWHPSRYRSWRKACYAWPRLPKISRRRPANKSARLS